VSVVDHNAIELGPRISEAEVGDYIALLKPRVTSLVIFTALVGSSSRPAISIRSWPLPRSSASRSAPARRVR